MNMRRGLFRMMTRFSAGAVVLASLVVVAGTPLSAFAGKSCNDDPSGNPHEALQLLDEVEAFVPFVPPEDASYFDKEEGAAVAVNSSQRLNALAQRPHYFAWKLHIAFTEARDILKQVGAIPETGDIKWRIRMASRIPFRLSNARSAWDDYVWTDYSHTLVPEQVGRGTEDMTKLAGLPQFYIWCLVGLIN